MSKIIQLYSDKNKKIKAYPKTLASEVYMDDGTTNISTEVDNKIKEVNSQLDDKANKAELDTVKNDYAKKTEVNILASDKADKTYVDTKVATISSGTPLFASSVAGMTDNTKNYVNTTDGFYILIMGLHLLNLLCNIKAQGLQIYL